MKSFDDLWTDLSADEQKYIQKKADKIMHIATILWEQGEPWDVICMCMPDEFTLLINNELQVYKFIWRYFYEGDDKEDLVPYFNSDVRNYYSKKRK